MTLIATIIASLFSLASVALSSYLVYRATVRNSKLTENDQTYKQTEGLIEGLRADIKDLDDQRRLYYIENVRLLKTIEKYRAWAYGLVRLLTDRGVTDLPPEPEEAE